MKNYFINFHKLYNFLYNIYFHYLKIKLMKLQLIIIIIENN